MYTYIDIHIFYECNKDNERKAGYQFESGNMGGFWESSWEMQEGENRSECGAIPFQLNIFFKVPIGKKSRSLELK